MNTRRDLLVAAAAVSLTFVGLTLAQSVAKPVLHSAVFNWAHLKPVPTKAGERRAACDAPTATLRQFECHITTLNPGEAPHAAHRHPDEELMIVKEGTLEAVQGDRTNLVPAGGIIFQGSNELHGLRNAGTNQAVYYVLKFVPRDLAK